ncbi:MAG: hypothetical protein LBT38_07945 [Deltaproteobacteria bacterium]|jgi:hypothetical protein|nr:hypothetical protein [Deltaproteobacteria bacterium]
MKYSFLLADQTQEVLRYFREDSVAISEESLELFDVAANFFYNYHVKEMPKFISCARYFVFFDRLIIYCAERLEKLYPGFKDALEPEELGYLEKLDIIKNFIQEKLTLVISLRP